MSLSVSAPQKAAPADGDAMDDDDDEEKEAADKGGGDAKASPPAPKSSREVVTVTPYVLPNPGPYPQVRGE